MIAHILLWNLVESKTNLDELRTQLPELGRGDAWIANEAQERFGVVSTSGTLPDLSELRELIGKDPEIAEEYDVLSSDA